MNKHIITVLFFSKIVPSACMQPDITTQIRLRELGRRRHIDTLPYNTFRTIQQIRTVAADIAQAATYNRRRFTTDIL